MNILTESLGTKRIYVNTIGARLYIPIDMSQLAPETDLSKADVRLLEVRKPDGVEVVWEPVVHNEPGYLCYVTQDGDLCEAGHYYVKVYFEFPAGFQGYIQRPTLLHFIVYPLRS